MDKAAFYAKLQEIQDRRDDLDSEENDLVENAVKFAADAWNKMFPEGSEEREYRGKPADPQDLVMPRTWECEDEYSDGTPRVKSPVGYCVYDIVEDPACDACIFCGAPEERK